MTNHTNDTETNQAQRLLAGLHAQRAELGEIANELISLLTAAGVGIPDGMSDRSGDSFPADGVGAEHDGTG